MRSPMAHFKTIPTPPGEAWRLFRTRLLPVVVFAVVLLTVVALWRKHLGASLLIGEVETGEVVVNSGQAGVLSELKVRAFDAVRPLQVLGRVVGADPKNPSILVSPIEGNITRILHSTGEKIAAGDPVFVIAGMPSDRIVAYLRQPIRVAPVEGQPVKVQPRARAAAAQGQILKVAPQLAPIPGSLLSGSHAHAELGLPIIVSIPPELKLFPGEIVDLTLLPMPPEKL